MRRNIWKTEQFEEMFLIIDFDLSEVPSANQALAIELISPRDIGAFFSEDQL